MSGGELTGDQLFAAVMAGGGALLACFAVRFVAERFVELRFAALIALLVTLPLGFVVGGLLVPSPPHKPITSAELDAPPGKVNLVDAQGTIHEAGAEWVKRQVDDGVLDSRGWRLATAEDVRRYIERERAEKAPTWGWQYAMVGAIGALVAGLIDFGRVKKAG